MQIKTTQSRAIALLTGGVIAATTLFHPAPAMADKSKNYKIAGIGLGILGAVMLGKNKALPGAALVAGGIYAYKKGRHDQNDHYQEKRYGRNDWNNGNDWNHDGGHNQNWQDGNWSRDDRRNDWRDNRGDDRRDNRRDNVDLSQYLR